MNILQQFLNFYRRDRSQILVSIFLILIIGSLAVSGINNQAPSTGGTKDTSSAPEGSDQWIPEGWVLFPIQLQNHEALMSLIGDFAWADLYIGAGESHRDGLKVARKIKLIRSPSDANQLAVLIPEDQAQKIAQLDASYFAVIRRRDTKEARNSKKPQNTSRIKMGETL